MTYLQRYFYKVPEEDRTAGATAFYASLDQVATIAPSIAVATLQELRDQSSHLKLIASENYCSLATQQAMGTLLTDKYAEGTPFHRFYAGCENVDAIEAEAVNELKLLFGADHAYVQPHSGCDANLVAFWAILTKRIQDVEVERLGKKSVMELNEVEYEQVRQLMCNQKLMGMGLASGGHLTHGFRQNLSSKMMQAFCYEVDLETGVLDYEKLASQVKEVKPLILLAGYSAYPRKLDFAKMREIADSVGAVLMVDMAHFAGLVAGKVLTGDYNPIPFADVVTSTTHKTLRGPRGGIVLCKKEFAEAVDRGCPHVQGGPLPHVMAAKAVAFKEANHPNFATYAHQVVANAQALAEGLQKRGAKVVTGGTENHLLVVDVRSYGLTGRQAESVLREAGMTVNRNSIPADPNGAWYTSGIRLGTPALTTLGMGEAEMDRVASFIHDTLSSTKSGEGSRAKYVTPEPVLHRIQKEVAQLLEAYPLYPELQIEQPEVLHASSV